MEFNRATDGMQGAYCLAILFALGYLAIIGALLFVEIPAANKEVFLTLIGLMSAALLAIIKYYFDGSKGAESAQQANIARAAKTDSVVAGIATGAPPVFPKELLKDGEPK